MSEYGILTRLLIENNCKFTSVLDVGCGVSVNQLNNLAAIYNLRNKFNAKYFTGIDKNIKSREDVIFSFRDACGSGVIYEFLDNLNIQFKHLDLEYIETSTFSDEKFDLIILSNVLHLFEKTKARDLYQYFLEMLNPNSYAFIKVANEHHKDWEENKSNLNYRGPIWGMSKVELEEFVQHTIISQGENSDNRYVLLRK